MSKFEYVAVFFSLIIGLGLVHILTGIAQSIHHRNTIKLYWGHTVWVINCFQYLVSVWWALFAWTPLQEWSFSIFFFLILYSTVIFLLAGIIVPFDMKADLDFKEYFIKNKKWFFGVLILSGAIDQLDTYGKAFLGVRDYPEGYLVYSIILTILGVSSLLVKNIRYASFAGLGWLAMDLYFHLIELANLGGLSQN